MKTNILKLHEKKNKISRNLVKENYMQDNIRLKNAIYTFYDIILKRLERPPQNASVGDFWVV